MRVGITGIEGFIGVWLRDELRRRGHTVCGIDKNTPTDMAAVQADLLDREVAARWLDMEEPDAVVHLAAQVGRVFGEEDLKHTVASNAVMTTLVARACGERNIRIAYASTSEVYGDQGDIECDEYGGPFSLPHNLYGLSKRWGEEVCELYAPDDLVVYRPSMPYGPGVRPGRGRAALPNMLWQAVNGLLIPVHRGSERSWCWIGDTVAAMATALEAATGGALGTPAVFNIGRDDDPMPMCAIAERACYLTGASYDLIEKIDPPENQTVVKRLSTGRIRDLGWEPKVSLRDGIDRTLAWVRRFDEHGVAAWEKEGEPGR